MPIMGSSRLGKSLGSFNGIPMNYFISYVNHQVRAASTPRLISNRLIGGSWCDALQHSWDGRHEYVGELRQCCWFISNCLCQPQDYGKKGKHCSIRYHRDSKFLSTWIIHTDRIRGAVHQWCTHNQKHNVIQLLHLDYQVVPQPLPSSSRTHNITWLYA